MKHWNGKSLIVLGALAPLIGLTGCELRAYPNGAVVASPAPIYVEDGPPPIRDEVVGVAPGPDFVWIGGRWRHDSGRWAWEDGRWAARPHAGAVWIAGRWDHHGRGYVWHDGRWR